MARRSTFESSIPSGNNENNQSKPNKTPVRMTSRENDGLSFCDAEVARRTKKVLVTTGEYTQFKQAMEEKSALEQNVSTLTQQNARLKQKVSTINKQKYNSEQKVAETMEKVTTLERELREAHAETNRKAQECEAKQEQAEKLEQQLQELELKHRAGQVQVEAPISIPEKSSCPSNQRSPIENCRSYTKVRRVEKNPDVRPNVSSLKLFESLSSPSASSCVKEQTCLSPPQFVAKPRSGAPKPPVEYIFWGRPCVRNSLGSIFPLELGEEMDACKISDIEGARFAGGFWFLYSRKSSKTYFMFDGATVAKVNLLKIEVFAFKYQIWGLLAKPLIKDGT
ncbi:hypothetical protein DICA1_A07492 [Diutina catenulata]